MARSFEVSLLAIPADDLPNDERKCPICMSEYYKADCDGIIEWAASLEKMGCKHVIGNRCLETWLNEENTCPLCRNILFDDHDDEDHDISEDSDEEIDSEHEEALVRAIVAFEEQRPPTLDEEDERESTGPRYNFYRRRALADFKLYQEFRKQQLRSGDLPILPYVPADEKVLHWRADKELFKHLQNIGAFTKPGMFTYRRINSCVSDEELYERLRDQGVKWSLPREAWLLYGRRMSFCGIDPELSAEEEDFDYLQQAGAFRLPGISHYFRSPDEDGYTPSDYEVWQKIKAGGATSWEARYGWLDASGSVMYRGRNHTIDGDRDNLSEDMLGRAGVDYGNVTRTRSRV
ncbi:hypothetical protein N7G274_008675 [Stereocaulon virgatum]|uniref:RING-type domain-containing protein n=1 Tax=Stereocaulon virgatum TaxID=373712 RepID=A0ABR4A2M7_9LECA